MNSNLTDNSPCYLEILNNKIFEIKCVASVFTIFFMEKNDQKCSFIILKKI